MAQLTADQQAKHFAIFLRRILILQKLIHHNIQGCRKAEYLPKEYAAKLTGLANSLHTFMGYQRSKATKDNWDEIAADLESDRLHDISLLIDEVADIKDISNIIEAIAEGKKNYTAEKTIAA